VAISLKIEGSVRIYSLDAVQFEAVR
jgi:hypothetical protein